MPLPLPPAALVTRVGTVEGEDPFEFYLAEGARLRGVIEGLLPSDWDWAGKRVLDFGCGSARVLRHFAAEAAGGEFWGCDIDEASVAWASSELSPPFRFFRNGLVPPLDLAGGSLDLVWAMSVFTHISELWADWLLELRRLLAPGGVLVASYLGEGMWQPLVGDPYVEDAVGMAVLHHADGPDAWVFHSEWWLREHWGRAFEPLAVSRPPREADGRSQITHSYIALRRREIAIGREELERPNPDEPRELAGLGTALRLARMDIAELATRPQSPPASRWERALRRLLAARRR